MIIFESPKHTTPEELEQIKNLYSQLSKQTKTLERAYKKCVKNGEDVNDNKTLKKYRLENRELIEQLESIQRQGQTHFLENKTDSELIAHATKTLDSLTFEDFIDFLSAHNKIEWIQHGDGKLNDFGLNLIYDFTDFGLIIDYFSRSPLPTFETHENQFRDLATRAEKLSQEFANELYQRRDELPTLFKQARERAEKRREVRTITSETNIEYQPKRPNKYMSLTTSMISQEVSYALSRARATQLSFSFDEPLEQGGYRIIPIEDKKLGLKGLALGYQKTTNPKKSARQKTTTHPIFVLQNADIIESKHNYNPRKLYIFILDKLFGNDYLREGATMPPYIDITTKELLDNGVFNSRKEAIDGLNESIIPLTSLSIAEFDKNTQYIKGVSVLFPSIKKLEGKEKTVTTYRISFQNELNYLAIFNQFTPCPNYIYRLPNRSGTLLYKLFTNANMNKEKFLEGEVGKINIPLTTIQDYLDLPSLESVSKSRKENERILKPIQEAISQITELDKKMYPDEPIIKLTLSSREGLSAKEYIQKGYLTLEIKSDYILKKYREIATDHEHKKEVTRKRIARNKRTKSE